MVYPCIDPEGRRLEKATLVALRKIYAIEKEPHEWAPACEAPPWLYAIDVMVPFLDLKVESSCGFLHKAEPWWPRGVTLAFWHFTHAVGAIFGAIAIPLAALTFAGLLRRE